MSPTELAHRTIRRADLVADEGAFVDTKIPGSQGKINYPLIGPGVSENDAQVIPVTEPHGFNLGAAAMPAGVTNNLHLHFTAEVFTCIGGDWTFRWGVDGDDGEALVRKGDVISIPTWVFRGFTSSGEDPFLFTALGRDFSGGLIWAPSVLEESAKHGMHLSAQNKIIETAAGEFPAGIELKRPLSREQLATLRHYSTEEMGKRLVHPEDLMWSAEPFLDSTLRSGGARLAAVIGYGASQDRDQLANLTDQHGFQLSWLRAEQGRGMSAHRMAEPQVLIVTEGRWRVTLNRRDEVSTEIGAGDTFSVPPSAWRRFEAVSNEPAQAVVITSGDGRCYPEWEPNVVIAARQAGRVIDPNGYVAASSMMTGS